VLCVWQLRRDRCELDIVAVLILIGYVMIWLAKLVEVIKRTVERAGLSGFAVFVGARSHGLVRLLVGVD
jgi:hypothetical protein